MSDIKDLPVNFSTLLLSLASSAVLAMGLEKNPQSDQMEKDLDLARFNIDDSQRDGFKGVPIPAAGMMIASLPLIAHYDYFNGAINNIIFNKWFLYALILLMSYLMISTLPLLSIKFKDAGIKNNLPKIALAVITIVAALLLKWLAVPLVFICYIALSLSLKNKAT